MSDDIVARLRDPSLGSPRWMDTMAEAADHIEAQAAYIRELRECLVQYVELDWPKAEQHKRARDIIMQTWEYKRSRVKPATGGKDEMDN